MGPFTCGVSHSHFYSKKDQIKGGTRKLSSERGAFIMKIQIVLSICQVGLQNYSLGVWGNATLSNDWERSKHIVRCCRVPTARNVFFVRHEKTKIFPSQFQKVILPSDIRVSKHITKFP